MSAAESPHRRRNALTGDWVLISPHRTKRPWQGKVEAAAPDKRPAYDPHCYLCPGNTRANGESNPAYESVHVFDNDFAALLPVEDTLQNGGDGLLQAESATGECRVMCFSPRHDLTLARMQPQAIRLVIDAWSAEITTLGQRYRWVQIFENKGDTMGCSNPHPHGQIWASSYLPHEAAKEDRAQETWLQQKGSILLLDYAAKEMREQDRIVIQNEHWLAVVPWWAVWPYEILLLPVQRHIPRMTDLREDERDALASIMKRLLTRYDNLFNTSFPYSMGWHGAPTMDDSGCAHWQLHAHFYPPLLRSASVKKFMVGYEMLGEPQRDITAESAAEKLRACSEQHYLDPNP